MRRISVYQNIIMFVYSSHLGANHSKVYIVMLIFRCIATRFIACLESSSLFGSRSHAQCLRGTFLCVPLL